MTPVEWVAGDLSRPNEILADLEWWDWQNRGPVRRAWDRLMGRQAPEQPPPKSGSWVVRVPDGGWRDIGMRG
jgi:hypothetical protein